MRLDEQLEQASHFLAALDYPLGLIEIEWTQFPREVGLKRDVVKDRFEFGAYYMSCIRNRVAGYVSLYPAYKLNISFFDVIFLDIDFHENSIDETQLEALGQLLVERLRKYLLSAVVISGRGIHLYFALPKHSLAKVLAPFLVDLFPYEFMAVRRLHRQYAICFVKYLVENERDIFEQVSQMGGKVDTSCVGDVRRMVRLPGTVNEKNGRLCRLLYVGTVRGTPSVDEKTMNMFRDVIVAAIVTSERGEGDMGRKKKSDNVLVYEDFYPPCIAEMVGKLAETGELDHVGRVTLASYLLARGWSEDDVVDVFRVASDFKEHYTRYQVNYLKSRNFKPYGCSRLMSEGLCPYRCELFPHMLKGLGR